MESETSSCITVLSSTKRKREGEGEAAESQRKRRPVLTITTEALVDAHALFYELAQARLYQGIYKNKFGDWSTDDLWLAIGNEMYRPANVMPPTKESMLQVVSYYRKAYIEDPNLPGLPNRDLKRNIETVFEDLSDRGSLQLDDRGIVVVNVCEDEVSTSRGRQGRRGSRGSSDVLKMSDLSG